MAATIYVAKNAASIMKAFKGQESASLPEVIWIFQLQEDPTIDEYTVSLRPCPSVTGPNTEMLRYSGTSSS